MVFLESQGDNDFGSLFPSVAEEVKEDEEKRQTEMFLRLLDDIDSRTNNRNNTNSSYDAYSSYESSDDEEDDDDDYREYLRQRKRRNKNKRRKAGPHREYLKVSITDDEKKRLEREKKHKEEERKRSELVKKVHTLDDLPPDELDFAQLFGVPSVPEPPELNVTAGRRLKDGKIVYNATFPNLDDFGIELGSFNFQLEYVIIFFLVVFLIGIFIGRRAASAKHKRKVQALTKAHTDQLKSIQEQIKQYNNNNNTNSRQQQQQQPIYIPVPIGQWNQGQQQQQEIKNNNT